MTYKANCSSVKNFFYDNTIHQLFEEQVKKFPDAIAIVFDDQELTYRQLNQKANKLAHFMRHHGVKPDSLVAIAVERSIEMIICLLGVLKAGAAYVPLDPTYPQKRLQFMLEDTQAPILITQTHLQDLFKGYVGHVLLIGSNQSSFEAYSQENPLPLTSSYNLAYVIYTSGSTGRPKGVMITNGNVIRLVKKTNYINLSSSKRIAQTSNVAFDAATFEIWGALLNGACLVIITKLSLLSQGDFIAKVEEHRVDTLWLTASLFNQMIETNKEKFPKLKTLLIGGEAIDPFYVRKLYKINKSIPKQLLNGYGPTESTTFASCFSILKNDAERSNIPIGQPISNTQMYILDEYLNTMPEGTAGEICIGGKGLARGYLNRPDLTAERFIPNPFINQEGDLKSESLRLYCTGDLARYLPDGNIEFQGRIDDQVKIRGFRIELGEIEATLITHKDVNQVITLAPDDESGNKRLVAYIVPQAEILASLTPEAQIFSSSKDSFFLMVGEALPNLTESLRSYLAYLLPDHMMPAFFVYLNKIPLNSNGKVDRQSLPTPDLSFRFVEGTYISPSTDIEQSLCSVWSEVLKVEKIGIHDSFFKLGGDSIISLLLVAKARSRGIYFTSKDVFNHPTVAGLISVAKTEVNNIVCKPDQNLITGDIYLTPIQHWFFKNNLKNMNHFNQAILLQSSRKLDTSLLNQVFSFLVSHHDTLRLNYHQDTYGNWIQTSLANLEPLTIQEIDLSHILTEDHLAQAIEKYSSSIQQTLNIEKGPLIQIALFNCAESKSQRLLIVIHHLVVDGVSWRILLEDLEKLYTQLAQGEISSLPSKTHSYQQWASSLKEYASSNSLKGEIPYWQKTIEAIQPLPCDFNYGPAIGRSVCKVTLSLSEDETSLLLLRVPRAYQTEINDILLTALVFAIGDWTNTYAISLSLEGHGREDIIKDIDLSRTVGWFTAIFPVNLSINNPNDLGGSIKVVKEYLRRIPHKGIGFGILSYLTQEPFLSASSRPMLSFNYLGQWDNALPRDGFFTFSQESIGRDSSSENVQAHLIEVTGEVKQGILHFLWSYSRNHYRQQTIEKVAHAFTERLKLLIQHCCQENTFGYTPSDFKLAKMNEESLESKLDILSKLGII